MAEQTEPLLGLATTERLIEELRVRVEVGRIGRDQQDTIDALGWLSGFKGRLSPEELAYRTVDS